MHHTVTHVHSTPEADQLISYMARVSNPSNQNNTSTSPRLIKYLIDHNHWSPFEMVNMCVQIDTTRSIASQILRHRSFSFQEFSQRYAPVELKPAVPAFRRQDTKNRQNSIDDIPDTIKAEFDYKTKNLYEMATILYNEMLAAGIAKECARDVLPLSTRTRLYMNGTLRSWLHYCDLRSGNGTQLEHKIIADQCKELIAIHFPVVYSAMWSNVS